ncbi:uncharacterized protein G2W53_034057 [Senna tora]|uniref:Uncharacterized protein n=1 Tax=Senna tora TaxID=362788 RepID=A0A834WBJ4_9FABA|nr:uncharacterized protein G2W53_034057 [Senna tora]
MDVKANFVGSHNKRFHQTLATTFIFPFLLTRIANFGFSYQHLDLLAPLPSKNLDLQQRNEISIGRERHKAYSLSIRFCTIPKTSAAIREGVDHHRHREMHTIHSPGFIMIFRICFDIVSESSKPFFGAIVDRILGSQI